MAQRLLVPLVCLYLCVQRARCDSEHIQSGRQLRQARLDYSDQYHADQHPHGAELIAWLSDASQVLPEPVLPSGRWPQNLVIGYAGGYTYELLKPLIIGFLANVKEGALVLLTPSGRIPNLPAEFTHRVIVQKHEMPTHIPEDYIPYAVTVRFYVARALLKQIRHTGKAFMCDSRDVFIQRDMFEAFDDDYLHFPRESGAYRLRGPFSQNSNWITQCYGKTTLEALGGHYVLNSGTFLGPSQKLVGYIELLLEEFKHRWHCMRQHGSDQAIHNVLVYTGKLIGTELEFSIEDLESGRFAHVAWVHGGLLDFRAASDDRDDLYNRVGDPFVAIHLWSAESDVGKQVVLPFVAEFEPRLLNGDLTKTLQPNSLLREVAAQSQQADLDATVAGVDSELATSEIGSSEASNAAAGSHLGIASSRNTAAGTGQSAAVSSDTAADKTYVAAADNDVLVNPSVAAAGRGTTSDAGQATTARNPGQARSANRTRRRRQSEPRQNVQ